MVEKHLEDLEAGDVFDCGTHEVTRDAMVAFAEQYDPLAFHVDEAAAEETVHGGLIASGWYTIMLAHRLSVDAYRQDLAVVAGVQVDEMTWPEPVRADDELSVRVVVRDTRPSESNPDVGVVTQDVIVSNQRDVEVASYTETTLIRRRE